MLLDDHSQTQQSQAFNGVIVAFILCRGRLTARETLVAKLSPLYARVPIANTVDCLLYYKNSIVGRRNFFSWAYKHSNLCKERHAIDQQSFDCFIVDLYDCKLSPSTRLIKANLHNVMKSFQYLHFQYLLLEFLCHYCFLSDFDARQVTCVH